MSESEVDMEEIICIENPDPILEQNYGPPVPMALLQVQFIDEGEKVYKVLVPHHDTKEEYNQSGIPLNPIICQVHTKEEFINYSDRFPDLKETRPPLTSFVSLSEKFKTVKSIVKLPVKNNPLLAKTDRPFSQLENNVSFPLHPVGNHPPHPQPNPQPHPQPHTLHPLPEICNFAKKFDVPEAIRIAIMNKPIEITPKMAIPATKKQPTAPPMTAAVSKSQFIPAVGGFTYGSIPATTTSSISTSASTAANSSIHNPSFSSGNIILLPQESLNTTNSVPVLIPSNTQGDSPQQFISIITTTPQPNHNPQHKQTLILPKITENYNKEPAKVVLNIPHSEMLSESPEVNTPAIINLLQSNVSSLDRKTQAIVNNLSQQSTSLEGKLPNDIAKKLNFGTSITIPKSNYEIDPQQFMVVANGKRYLLVKSNSGVAGGSGSPSDVLNKEVLAKLAQSLGGNSVPKNDESTVNVIENKSVPIGRNSSSILNRVLRPKNDSNFVPTTVDQSSLIVGGGGQSESNQNSVENDEDMVEFMMDFMEPEVLLTEGCETIKLEESDDEIITLATASGPSTTSSGNKKKRKGGDESDSSYLASSSTNSGESDEDYQPVQKRKRTFSRPPANKSSTSSLVL